MRVHMGSLMASTEGPPRADTTPCTLCRRLPAGGRTRANGDERRDSFVPRGGSSERFDASPQTPIERQCLSKVREPEDL